MALKSGTARFRSRDQMPRHSDAAGAHVPRLAGALGFVADQLKALAYAASASVRARLRASTTSAPQDSPPTRFHNVGDRSRWLRARRDARDDRRTDGGTGRLASALMRQIFPAVGAMACRLAARPRAPLDTLPRRAGRLLLALFS